MILLGLTRITGECVTCSNSSSVRSFWLSYSFFLIVKDCSKRVVFLAANKSTLQVKLKYSTLSDVRIAVPSNPVSFRAGEIYDVLSMAYNFDATINEIYPSEILSLKVFFL